MRRKWRKKRAHFLLDTKYVIDVYSAVVFIETPTFTRQITELVEDDTYGALQEELTKHPKKGKLIVGGGGIRKIRWDLGNGHGKSGGIRVIYYYKLPKEQILLLFAYPKNVADTLTDAQTKILKTIAKEFCDET